MYEHAIGLKQDYFEAVKWYRKAAEQGDEGAQTQLGFAYALGRGVQPNKELAKQWFSKACNKGVQMACEAYIKLN